MHLGYFADDSVDNDTAKLKSNAFLAKQVGIPAGKEIYIADLGCGIGGTCIYLAQNYPLAKICGINISQEQIDFANKVKKQNNINGQIEYYISDYAETKLQSGKFDFVIGVESICHAHDKSKVYREAYRLLKSGGVFAMMDYFEEKKPVSSVEVKQLDIFRKGWAAVEYIRNYEILLTQAGFKTISAVSILEKVMPGIQHSYKKAIDRINSGEFSGFSTAFQNHLKACAALHELAENKIIDYKIIVAQK
ncbi:MAG: 27-O-demethylrifamycin SV methyltransferase [Bacteroidia bacterium]|nr:27-O-demethylrifamycin SV methyltransferase [Bacteroidia bacterium]